MKLETITGPLGPFLIPAEPQNTRDHAEWICKMVFDGEYEHPELPKDVATILDIGSHCGSVALWAEAKWGPLQKVYCLDPNESACRIAIVSGQTRDDIAGQELADQLRPSGLEHDLGATVLVGDGRQERELER